MTDPLAEIMQRRRLLPERYPADFDAVVGMLEDAREDVERLRGLLGRLEWATDDGIPACPACKQWQAGWPMDSGDVSPGHTPGCWLAAELKNDPSHPEG